MSKIHEIVYELLEELASNNQQWPSDRSMPKRAARVMDLYPTTNLLAQLTTIIKKLGNLNENLIQTNIVCDLCERDITTWSNVK